MKNHYCWEPIFGKTPIFLSFRGRVILIERSIRWPRNLNESDCFHVFSFRCQGKDFSFRYAPFEMIRRRMDPLEMTIRRGSRMAKCFVFSLHLSFIEKTPLHIPFSAIDPAKLPRTETRYGCNVEKNVGRFVIP